MELLSKEDVKEKLKEYDALMEQAKNVLRWYHQEVEEIPGYEFLFDIIYIEDFRFCYEGKEYHKCGCSHHTFNLPICLAYDSEARERYKERFGKPK